MGRRAGRKGYIYRNGATWAAPSWSHITLVRDASLPASRAEIDAAVRGDTWATYLTGVIEAGAEFTIAMDPTDDNYQALEGAFKNDTNVELAIMSGPITTGAERGLRAEFKVTQFNRQEGYGDLMTVDVVVKPAADYTNAPTFYVIGT